MIDKSRSVEKYEVLTNDNIMDKSKIRSISRYQDGPFANGYRNRPRTNAKSNRRLPRSSKPSTYECEIIPYGITPQREKRNIRELEHNRKSKLPQYSEEPQIVPLVTEVKHKAKQRKRVDASKPGRPLYQLATEQQKKANEKTKPESATNGKAIPTIETNGLSNYYYGYNSHSSAHYHDDSSTFSCFRNIFYYLTCKCMR